MTTVAKIFRENAQLKIERAAKFLKHRQVLQKLKADYEHKIQMEKNYAQARAFEQYFLSSKTPLIKKAVDIAIHRLTERAAHEIYETSIKCYNDFSKIEDERRRQEERVTKISTITNSMQHHLHSEVYLRYDYTPVITIEMKPWRFSVAPRFDEIPGPLSFNKTGE